MRMMRLLSALVLAVAVLIGTSPTMAETRNNDVESIQNKSYTAAPRSVRNDVPMTSEKGQDEQLQTVSEEAAPSRVRDDIISDGNFLSYDLQEIMLNCSEEYGVPYAVLLAMADTESRFDPDVVSSTNDYGIMQINKCNHKWLLDIGIDPMTHAGNIEAGAYIMAQNLQKYGELELALMAYNCGPTGAKKLWDSGIYQTDYTKKVMTAFKHWSGVLEV